MNPITNLAFRIAFALVVPLFWAKTSVAEIEIQVSGEPGTGLTTWTFSGSATIERLPVTVDNNDDQVGWGWHVGEVLFKGRDSNIDFIETTARLSDGVREYEIGGVGTAFARPDSVFGIALTTLMSTRSFAAGTTLEFSGSALAAIDIEMFKRGTTRALTWVGGDYDQGDLGIRFDVVFEGDVGAEAIAMQAGVKKPVTRALGRRSYLIE